MNATSWNPETGFTIEDLIPDTVLGVTVIAKTFPPQNVNRGQCVSIGFHIQPPLPRFRGQHYLKYICGDEFRILSCLVRDDLGTRYVNAGTMEGNALGRTDIDSGVWNLAPAVMQSREDRTNSPKWFQAQKIAYPPEASWIEVGIGSKRTSAGGGVSYPTFRSPWEDLNQVVRIDLPLSELTFEAFALTLQEHWPLGKPWLVK